MTLSHVLVPLDGSPLANEALEFALDQFACPITVLNVVTPLDATMSEAGIVDPRDQRMEKAQARATEVIGDAETTAVKRERTVETAIETGQPAETILEFAEKSDVDHVVMGSHSQDTLHPVSRLLGTVATTVVSEAEVSVTVIR